MSMLSEFREFAVKGNAVDMAVGIIIGGAFGKLVTSLVNDVVMPPLGMLLGQVPFNDLFIPMGSGRFDSWDAANAAGAFNTLAAAKAAGVPTIAYGLFINNVIDFTIMAFCIFLVVRQMNHIKQILPLPKPAPEPTTKTCPECLSTVPIKAKRCAYCTSPLEGN